MNDNNRIIKLIPTYFCKAYILHALSKLIIFYLKLFTTPNTVSATMNNYNFPQVLQTPPRANSMPQINTNNSPVMGSTQFNSIAMQPNYVSAPKYTVNHLTYFRSGLYLSGLYHTYFGLEPYEAG